MATLTADVVVVELEARLNQYNQAVNQAANNFQSGAGKIKSAADQADSSAKRLGDDIGSKVVPALNKVPAAADNAAAGINRSRFATANLAAQFNDVGVMIASGQSPFILMLQQGTQVAQVMSMVEGGVSGAGQTIAAAFRSIISPVSLLSIGLVGLTAVVGQWAIGALSGAEDVDDANKRLTSTIDRLKDAYGETKLAVEELTEAERIRLALLTERDLQAAQREYNDALRRMFVGPQGNERLNAFFPDPGDSEHGQQLRDVIDAVIASVRAGEPDVEAFREGLERVMFAADDPAIDNIAQMLLDLATPTADASERVRDLADTLLVLTDAESAEAEAARVRLGVMTEGERTLAAHAALLRDIGRASGEASEANAILLVQLRASTAALRDDLATTMETVSQRITEMFAAGLADDTIRANIDTLGIALNSLLTSIRAGEPDVISFRSAVAEMANLAPENAALQEFAQGLLDITDAAAQVQGAVAEADAAVKGLGATAAANKPPVDEFNAAIMQLKEAAAGGLDPSLAKSIYQIALAAADGAEQVAYLNAVMDELGLERGQGPSKPADVPKPPAAPRASRGGGGGGLTDAEREAQAIERTIANLRFQAEQLNRTAREQAVYNAYQQAGIDANHASAESVREAALALYDQREALRANEEAVKQLDDAYASLTNSAMDAFESWVTGAKTAEEAVRDLIKQLLLAEARALILHAINPAQNALGPISTLLMGLVGRNAEGTDNWRGGLTWVGERGPELVNLPRGSQVIPADRSRDMLGSLTFSPTTHINAGGDDPSMWERLRFLLDQRDRRWRDDLPGLLQRHRANRRLG